ncbi:ribonucleases p/MRP protein subunit POP1 domain-containing protein [Sarocladium implicatum]|nr:ribonucleases p/MRP protein subunit POP1 domain-containing protein [Sarocladium implicatum]
MGDGAKVASKKRPADGAPRGDASHQKRNKINSARAIPAQPAETALKDGELDLQAFVAAHEFEIRSLEQSMATSKAVSSTRAFQQVPRGLRRRTASHNPKRVPRRLRARATKEMAEDNTPMVEPRRRKPKTTRARIRIETAKRLGVLAKRKARKKQAEKEKAAAKSTEDVSMKDASEKSALAQTGVVGRKPRPKIRRDTLNEPPRPAAKFRRRQINKTWLPTHTWHAKRARMTDPRSPLWGFAIPMTPNEKVYRPTHRAQGNRGAVVWDASYFSTMRIFGNAAGLERVLKRLGVTKESCWNDKGQKWRSGLRSWTGLLTRELKSGYRGVAVATILWNPVSAQDGQEKGQDPKKHEREVFLRLHPSAFQEAFTEVVRLTKMETPRLHVEDLRYEIGSIELTGPASTEILQGVLTPYVTADSSGKKHSELFRAIKGLTNSASLPANAVLGFYVQDPRLSRLPSKEDLAAAADQAGDVLLQTLADWPAEEGLGPYGLFNRNVRHAGSQLPSQKQIDRRRGSAPPGTKLKPIAADPRIPIILLATRTGSGTQAQGNYTLLAPWACIQSFWHSMVRCPMSSGGNPRFGGVNEFKQVAFERGQPWFPGDYIATNAGVDFELAEREKRRRDWERRPKGKRTAWDTLDLGGGRKGEVGEGLANDFETLFGLPRLPSQKKTPKDVDDTDDAMDIDEKLSEGPDKASSPREVLRSLQSLTKADFINVSSAKATTELPSKTIITTRIIMQGNGVAKDRARVYRLPSTPSLQPPSSNAEVPATMPPPSVASSLPSNLRTRWLAQANGAATRGRSQNSGSKKPTKDMNLETRKRLLAQELIAPPARSDGAPSETLDAEGHHLLVPDSEDLIGFVTTGSYSLSEGQGVAIASLAVDKVVPGAKA